MAQRSGQGASGLNEAAGAPGRQEELGGAGGSSAGARFRAWASRRGAPSTGGGALAGSPDENAVEDALVAAGADSLATQAGNEAAAEAAALGSADGSLADAARGGRPSFPGAGPVGGETVGTGSGRNEVASGTPEDRSETGGGGPLGQHGGPGPSGVRSPGGNGAG